MIDPPWPMKKMHLKVREKQGKVLDYPVMSLEEIRRFKINRFAARDSYLFLWTTQKYLPPALEIMDHWGYHYLCTITWCKPTGICPFGPFQYTSEFVIFGTRGRTNFKDFSMGKVKTWFYTSGRPKHSQKPSIFYKKLLICTPRPRIDLFARRRHTGFAAWGNQVERR